MDESMYIFLLDHTNNKNKEVKFKTFVYYANN